MSAVIELGPGVRAGFTQRYDGGVSAAPFDTLNLGHGVDDDPDAVAQNRRVAAERFGFSAERVVWMDQVHSARVAVAAGPGSAGSVDAVVTDRTDLVLAALGADGLLVLAADAQAGIVGAAHSGRSGTRQGVVPEMVAEMARLGADPVRTSAVLGPAVCGACYEVGPEVQAEMARSVPEAAVRTRAGTAGIDLRAAVTAQLRAAGLGHISSDDRCTLESPELFSHRGGAPTGRFAGFVWRKQ
ncbi:peptidoglycan editing factor PgeF [Streptomonospora algeriensis]|uniref:Purine nucleoside phosphorylase n=1 Tax=Streptomonospora algeriensis TaxID=995084 RepID=A0ABW3BLF4_9ACTN